MAYFSNYGSKNVDVFAPGYQIYSSVPDDSKLEIKEIIKIKM